MKFKLNTSTIDEIERIIPELNPTEKGRYFSVVCPFCGKKEAFVYKNKQIIVCSRKNKCGKIIGLYEYLREIKGVNDKEIINLTFEDSGEVEDVIDIIREKIDIPEGTKFFNLENSGLVQNRFIKYLQNRNINTNYINDLGYIYGGNYEYNNSIFIPFFEDGELVYFQTRKIDKKSYINLNTDAKAMVYNIDRINENTDVFIFEGIFDALTLDGDNIISTAMITSKLSPEKAIKIIDRYPRSITIVPDLDLAGIYGLNHSLKILQEYLPTNGDIKIYKYIFDMNRYLKIEELVERKRMKLEDKVKEYDSWNLKGSKDFNEFVSNGGNKIIPMNERIEHIGKSFINKSYKLDTLKNDLMKSNFWEVV